MKYNILVIARWPVGGIATHISQLYNSFDEEIYNFTLILPNTHHITKLKNQLNKKNIECIIIAEEGIPYLKAVALYILRSKHIDLIHSHGYTANAACACIAKIKGIPHISSTHFTHLRENYTSSFSFLCAKLVINFCLRLTNTIICPTESCKAHLERFCPFLKKIPQKIATIAYGIHTNKFIHASPAPLETLCSPPSIIEKDSLLIGFFGRYEKPKGFTFLIEAVEHLSQEKYMPKFKIIAIGDGGYIREYKKQLKTKGIEEYFAFIPFQEDISPLLKSIDLVCIPSLQEAQGLVALESCAAGTPILASNCTGLHEVALKLDAQIFEAGNSNALASALKKCMDNLDEIIIKNHKKIDYIQENYDIQKTCTLIDLEYQKLLH